MRNKTLVVSGCSFTFEDWNWPTPTAEHFDMELINVGLASQGNGLISKKIIFKVQQLLKEGYNPDDLVVGIMWSGIDRHCIYTENPNPLRNVDGWKKNPTSVIEDESESNWVILNTSWKTPLAKKYYGSIHTFMGSLVRTLEYILYTQWFLERYNIKYFMTTYMDIFGIDKKRINLPDAMYLYDMIDFDKFIDVDGEHEWVARNYYEKGFPDIENKLHPTEYGHKKFSQEVIIPHLQNKVFKTLI